MTYEDELRFKKAIALIDEATSNKLSFNDKLNFYKAMGTIIDIKNELDAQINGKDESK